MRPTCAPSTRCAAWRCARWISGAAHEHHADRSCLHQPTPACRKWAWAKRATQWPALHADVGSAVGRAQSTSLVDADASVRALAAGENVPVQDVMIAMEHAHLQLQFAVEVRNRVSRCLSEPDKHAAVGGDATNRQSGDFMPWDSSGKSGGCGEGLTGQPAF